MRAVYGATKAGIVQFTKSVAVQYGPQGIRCTPFGRWPMTPAVSDMTDAQREASLRIYPMPRLCEPDDVASAVLFGVERSRVRERRT